MVEKKIWKYGSKEGMDEFQAVVGRWGKVSFPASTIATIHEHLRREARELLQALDRWDSCQKPVKDDVIWPSVMEEVADIVLISFHLAYRKRFSLAEVIEDKFIVAQHREWGEPDEDGVVEHIRPDKANEA